MNVIARNRAEILVLRVVFGWTNDWRIKYNAMPVKIEEEMTEHDKQFVSDSFARVGSNESSFKSDLEIIFQEPRIYLLEPWT